MLSAFRIFVIGNKNQMRTRKKRAIGNQSQVGIRNKQVRIRLSTSTGHVLEAKLNIIRTVFFRKPHPSPGRDFMEALKKYSQDRVRPKATPSFTRGGELKKKKKELRRLVLLRLGWRSEAVKKRWVLNVSIVCLAYMQKESSGNTSW